MDSCETQRTLGCDHMNDRKNCLVCGGTRLMTVRTEKNSRSEDPVLARYFQEDSVLVRCADCGMRFVRRVPEEAEFYSRLYADGDRDISVDFQFSGKTGIFREILRSLRRHQARGPLLDYGTGTGAFLREAAHEKFEVLGIELGSAARRFAIAQGFAVSDAPVGKLPYETEALGAVTLIDVLEHLTDPAEILGEVRRVLRPGGLLYIKVPNGPAQIGKQNLLSRLGLSNAGVMTDYIHINHFDPHSLRFLLERQGFRPRETGWSRAEVWDLRWKKAPGSFAARVFFNVVTVTVTRVLNTIASRTGAPCGLNFYILAEKT